MTESAFNAREVAASLTPQQKNMLLMYGPDTYAISFSKFEVAPLLGMELIYWVPRVFGSGIDYAISEKGKQVVNILRGPGDD